MPHLGGGWKAAALWGSPLLITAGVVVFFGLSLCGPRSTSTKASVFGSMAVVWALHAGYLLAPWLAAGGRPGLALALMIPVGAIFFLGGTGLALVTGIIADCLRHWLPATLGVFLLLLAALTYAGPVVALLV
ncbi:MAG TPA: hypothetical protein VF950_02725 [Planctomycetota bacterium]